MENLWLKQVDRNMREEVVAIQRTSSTLTASLELTPWNQRACAKNIVFRPQVAVQRVTARKVIGADIFDRQEIVIDDVDLVVDVANELPNEDLYYALKRAGVRVFRAGDGIAPRYMAQAILEGYRAGREV